MKTPFYAPALFLAIFLPFSANAQNVTAPTPGTAASVSSAPGTLSNSNQIYVQQQAEEQRQKTETQQKAALSAQANGTKQLPPVPSYPLDMALKQQPQALNMPLSPAAQTQLIENDKRNLNMLQGTLAQMQQTGSMISSDPDAQKNQALIAGVQQNNLQTMGLLQEKVAAIQKRLAVLQSGPLKISDISGLYQGGY